MPTENKDLIERLRMTQVGLLANFFPYYHTSGQGKEIFLVQTHVGSINAPAATSLALTVIKPDYVIKVGCIGGNSKGLQKNDVIVPLSFFHSGAWITRSHIDNTPTSDASLWQRLYGDKPYQNSKYNLGGLDFDYQPDEKITKKYQSTLDKMRIAYKKAHLGSGDMVIFDHGVMQNISQNVLKSLNNSEYWCTDNESHSIAHVCKIFNTPFSGVYFIASSDYDDTEGYDPESIQMQSRQTILPIVETLINDL